MVAKLPAAHSAYQRYTYSYQHQAAKTRGRLLANGVGFAVGGIVFVPVLVLFALWWLGSVEWEEMVRYTGGWAIAAAIAG